MKEELIDLECPHCRRDIKFFKHDLGRLVGTKFKCLQCNNWSELHTDSCMDGFWYQLTPTDQQSPTPSDCSKS